MNNLILVVDDDEYIRFSFSEFLKMAGYQVDVAENVRQSLDKLDSIEYDAIFLDVFLDGGSGIDVLRKLRDNSILTPVIMITGSPEVDTAAQALRLGAFDYVTKPIRKNELLLHAAKAVAHKNALSQSRKFEKRMRALFQGVSDGILVFDAANQLVDFNAAAGAITGLAPDAVGQDFPSIVSKGRSSVLDALGKVLALRIQGEIYRLECAHEGDSPTHISVYMAPLKTDLGAEDDFVMVVRDESSHPALIS